MLLKPSQSWVYNTAFHLPVLKNTDCQLVSRTVPFSHRPGSEIGVESGKKSRKKESLDLLESAQSFSDHLWFSLPIKGPSRILLASVAQLKSLLYKTVGTVTVQVRQQLFSWMDSRLTPAELGRTEVIMETIAVIRKGIQRSDWSQQYSGRTSDRKTESQMIWEGLGGFQKVQRFLFSAPFSTFDGD